MPTDLQSLRYLLLVADHQSFRRAATAIGASQTVVSRRIRALEDTIGVSLFERHSGGVRLTHAGIEFVKAMRRVLHELDAAVSIAENAGRGGTGRLVIGFYASLSTGELRDTLIEYLGRFPDVTVSVLEGTRSQLIAGLKNKATDIAIVTGEVDERIPDAMALWKERIMVAVPATHGLASQLKIQWEDLKDERFLLSQRDPGPEIHDFLMAQLAGPGDRPTVISHDASRDNVLSMVGARQGVSLLHECGTGATYDSVIYREINRGSDPTRVANVAYWSHTNDNPALRRFLSLLRERYGGAASLRVPAGE